MGYNYLPGTQVMTNDGGLALASSPSSKATLILGTSSKGLAATPYQVVDRASAAKEFGLQGTLIQAMEEVSQGGCDNILLFRIGTAAASLANIGTVLVDTGAQDSNGQEVFTAVDSNNVGYTIGFGTVTPTLATDYQVYYDGQGLLQVFFKGNLVYSNDPQNPVDTGDVTVEGAAIAGTPLVDSGASPSGSNYDKSLPLTNSLIASSTLTTDASSGGVVSNVTVIGGVNAHYTSAPTVSASGSGGSGTGFAATANINGSGDLTGITVTNGGTGYHAPITVTLTGGSPTTPATASATASAIVPASQLPALDLSLGDTGLSLTPGNAQFDPCTLYEALQDAFNELEILPIEQVYVPNARFDAPNVAFYSPSMPATDINNPANGKALGWLYTVTDSGNNSVYTWAHKTADSTGAPATPPSFVSGADRLEQGFHEVSFGYQLARFCAKQSRNQGGCLGFIGFNGPKNYKPSGLKTWLGYLPDYDGIGNFENQGLGNAISAGSGLCGTPYLTGTVSSKLNANCKEVATQSFRLPGFFQTVSSVDSDEFGEYDEAVVIDGNGYKTDMGAFIHAVADYALLNNSYSTAYASCIAGVTAGYCSSLDEKSALTNKSLPSVTQLYRLTMPQMNSLVQAKVNVLRFKGDNIQPALLHDRSCSLLTSDYTFLLRTRIKFLVTEALFRECDKFIGQSSTDGLSIAALQTAIDSDLMELQKRGYLRAYNYNVYSTLASQRLGQLFVNIVFSPANELVQVTANVSAGNL